MIDLVILKITFRHKLANKPEKIKKYININKKIILKALGTKIAEN